MADLAAPLPTRSLTPNSTRNPSPQPLSPLRGETPPSSGGGLGGENGMHPIFRTRSKVRSNAGSSRLAGGEEDDTMPRGRTFTREFKLAVVRQVESGERRPAQICREHGLADGVLWRWRREYGERGEAAFAAPAADSPEA